MKKSRVSAYNVALIFSLSLVLVIMLWPAGSQRALAGVHTFADSTLRKNAVRKPIIREVLLSQQLFVVNATQVKGNTAGNLFNLKGELRDAFMIIGYLDNGSVEELNWTMCPDGKCPETGTFKAGTKEYAKLDSLITKFKPQSPQQ